MIGYGKKKDFSGKSAEECRKLALERVYRSLTACEQSSKKLRFKLESEGYPSDSIDYALEVAEQKGFLSDKRYCEMLVRNALSQGKGMQGCLREVSKLDIDPMTLDSYAQYIEDEETTELDRAMEFLERHPPKAKDKRASAFRKLVTKGYSVDIASKASLRFCESLRRGD